MGKVERQLLERGKYFSISQSITGWACLCVCVYEGDRSTCYVSCMRTECQSQRKEGRKEALSVLGGGVGWLVGWLVNPLRVKFMQLFKKSLPSK